MIYCKAEERNRNGFKCHHNEIKGQTSWRIKEARSMVRLAAEGKKRKLAAKRPAQKKVPPGQQTERQRVDVNPH